MIAASRKNTLPANLQGIWANKLQNPWNADYHTNINVQMNYWPAEVTNLSEMHIPLLEYIKSLQAPGSRTAKIQYHASGWCIHPVTNIWGFTSPGEEPCWGLSLGCAGWLCQHLWEHYLFTLDKEYLQEVYPVTTGAAAFYLDWMIKDKQTGRLVSGPASSPENTFITDEGVKAQISMGPSHDQEIIHELFTNVLAAGKVLNKNDALLGKIENAKENILIPGIAKDGRLMEWPFTFKEAEEGHRHLSHLYALYPGYEFNEVQTPEFVAAAKKSLDFRIGHGGGYNGWSGAWASNLWARLKEGDKALEAIKAVLANNTAPNLFDVYPPFQIDGNYGTIAGMAEMLLQSHAEEIYLLPALPAEWENGQVTGLKARKGFEVNIRWQHHRLTSASVKSYHGGICKIKTGDPIKVAGIATTIQKTASGYLTSFKTQKGKAYLVSINK